MSLTRIGKAGSVGWDRNGQVCRRGTDRFGPDSHRSVEWMWVGSQ